MRGEFIMPFINVKTNVPVGSDKEKAIKSALGRDITALPGKTESWLMVGLGPECHLWFKGTDEPAALVDVSAGNTVNNGTSLTKNHLYMSTIAGRTLSPTSGTVKLLIRGGHKIG